MRDGWPQPAGRWAVLASYGLLAACTQLLWLTFAPIDTEAAGALHTDVGAVGDLAAVFPLIYVVLALPTGRWLDARFERALGAGALLTAGGALVRVVAPGSFGCQLAGQIVIAAGQPLVVNSINKVAGRYFPEGERASAISIGSVALFAGILAAVLTGGPLFASGGLGLVLWTQAVLTVGAALLVAFALRTPPVYAVEAPASLSLRWLMRDRLLWVLAGLTFIGMGTYNAVATWLQPVLERTGAGAAAGPLVAAMTFAGIVGAALLPPLVAARDRRRMLLLGAVGLTAITFVALSLRDEVPWVAGWLVAEGFLLMASLPVVLDWSEVHAGPARQGEAVGFLLMAGNLGGVVMVIAVQGLLSTSEPLLGLAAAGLLGLPLALRLPANVRTPRTAEASRFGP
jgi:predicted MFS family arabinose efflux permease